MLFHIEDRVVDPLRREISRGDDAFAPEPKVFDLLLYLIENRDRLVSKDDLIAAVWGGRIVTDSALTSAMNAARKALGDNGRDQRLIRTSSRKGYRFVGKVDLETVESSAAPSLDAATVANGPALALPDRPSIAVLPFLVSGGTDEDYLAQGMVEDLTTELSRIRWLFVIACNSTAAYRGQIVDTIRAGRELGVRYVLEGSVRRRGRHVRHPPA